MSKPKARNSPLLCNWSKIYLHTCKQTEVLPKNTDFWEAKGTYSFTCNIIDVFKY